VHSTICAFVTCPGLRCPNYGRLSQSRSVQRCKLQVNQKYFALLTNRVAFGGLHETFDIYSTSRSSDSVGLFTVKQSSR